MSANNFVDFENVPESEVAEPKIKCKVSIRTVIEDQNYLSFWCDEATANKFAKFGSINRNKSDNFTTMRVDKRFNFKEVVDYIRNYKSE